MLRSGSLQHSRGEWVTLDGHHWGRTVGAMLWERCSPRKVWEGLPHRFRYDFPTAAGAESPLPSAPVSPGRARREAGVGTFPLGYAECLVISVASSQLVRFHLLWYGQRSTQPNHGCVSRDPHPAAGIHAARTHCVTSRNFEHLTGRVDVLPHTSTVSVHQLCMHMYNPIQS